MPRYHTAERRPPALRLLAPMKPSPLLAAVIALTALAAAAEQPKLVSVHDGDTPARREVMGEIS